MPWAARSGSSAEAMSVTHTFGPSEGTGWPKAMRHPVRHSPTPSEASQPLGQLPQLLPASFPTVHAHVLSALWQEVMHWSSVPFAACVAFPNAQPIAQLGCWKEDVRPVQQWPACAQPPSQVLGLGRAEVLYGFHDVLSGTPPLSHAASPL